MRAHIPTKVRNQVKAKYDGKCAYCGATPPKLQIDHLVPVARSRGPDFNHNDISNLMPVCHPCNNYKLVFDLEQFRSMIKNQVGMCRQYSVNFRNAERYGLVKEINAQIVFYFERQQA